MVPPAVREPAEAGRALLPGEVPVLCAILRPRLQRKSYVNLIYKARTVPHARTTVNPYFQSSSAAPDRDEKAAAVRVPARTGGRRLSRPVRALPEGASWPPVRWD